MIEPRHSKDAVSNRRYLCTRDGQVEGLTHCCEAREVVLLAFYQRCRYIQQIATSELQCNAISTNQSLLKLLKL